jgi:glucuronoarabinoxylan endo-1,4-beta-xylanase
VDAAYSTPSVYISAYEGNGHLVIVAINMNTSAVSQPFTIQNQSLTSLVPYQTTASATVAPLSAVSVSGNQFTYTLPAQSITTFVQ